MKVVDPDYQLTDQERALLKSYLVSDGFKLLQKIAECEVEKFKVALLNTKPEEEKKVLAAHNLAKAAAQVWAGIVGRINKEMETIRYAPDPNEKPQDETEGKLDLDELTRDLPNFFGGESDFNEY